MINDNIVAISSGLSASGVAVIRISGNDPLAIAEKMFTPLSKINVRDFEPYKLYVGEFDADTFKDFGMCVYFKAPKSFTGEDVVEYHTHGGVAITKGILQKALRLGARLAKNGEFTKRAFINGKLSLASAEGLIDMINSESESGVKAGYYLYREKLTNEIIALQNDLTDILAEIDADMDFPEEDLEIEAKESASKTLKKVIDKTESLLNSFKVGRKILNGVKVAICGKPNTGKSSLLNGLLNYDKAIVSGVAGTTRDIVEGSIDIGGVKFNLYDTAGIRESQDEIETLGVSLSKRVLNECDLVLFVKDITCSTSEDTEIYNQIKDKNHIVVLNKIDKLKNQTKENGIMVSAKEKLNLNELRELMFEKTVGAGVNLDGDFLCEERHYEALLRAKEKLCLALNALEEYSLDLVSIDIKEGWDALGEVSGKTATEEIIDNIFAKFCVGK
ncbi:MAG: tRNA uridine-5-carboxymethylaminomethyl(34) synthesis GTPase MnmE [Clostridia bacterium]|nr:tRNA uridine-5-carboxymethylaminomethyl(34) synthesis GTPase MnmE [Clostridia bacterium]